MHAKTAENVSGLEQITENGNTGWRLVGQNPTNYGDIGIGALDLSFSSALSTIKGATGTRSTAMGYNAIASGQNSIAMGVLTRASGAHSTAIGSGASAETYRQTSLGTYNTAATGDASTFVSTDRLFVIGNGVNSSNKSNALTILKNGTITAPSLDITEITDDKSLITKEYFDANGVTPATGLERITEVASGWRLAGRNPANYGDIGANAIDLSYSFNAVVPFGAMGESSIAMGTRAVAEGANSVAMGYGATAKEANSVAIGNGARAAGISSIAMGSSSKARGLKSFSMGGIAKGDYSVTMGKGNTAETYGETILGINSTVSTGNVTTFVPTDRLFVIGNGTANNAKSDALVMLKNGNTTINGDLKVNEVHATDSGNADMKAYIYGLTGGSSTDIISAASSDGFSKTWVNTGHYRIYFDVPMNRTKYIAVATLHDGIGFINLIRQHNYFDVKTYNTSGILSDRSFYFVVYKK